MIKYFFIKGLYPTETKAELDATLAESAPSFITIKTWVANFKHGRTKFQDAQCFVRPKSDNQRSRLKSPQKIINDRVLKLMEVTQITGISKERTDHILTAILRMTKWVLSSLTPNQKI